MNKEVEAFYNNAVEFEWSRLDRHPLEYEITKRHIDSVLSPCCKILDIGGGPGKYAFHYAASGHKVTLIDIAAESIAFARRKQSELNLFLDRIETGNALDLHRFPDEQFDIVLCLGPLYHLVTEQERIQAIQECKRVVKHGGFIVFSFITIMAQTITLLRRDIGNIIEWENALSFGIEHGRNDIAFNKGFTDAYFIDPIEVEPFILQNGLEVVRVAGAEGLGCQSESALLSLSKAQFTHWIDFFYKYSNIRSTLGANQHVICIAKRK